MPKNRGASFMDFDFDIITDIGKVDTQGRLLFPKSMLDDADISAGQEVKQGVMNKKSLLVMSKPSIENILERYEKGGEDINPELRERVLRAYESLLRHGASTTFDYKNRIIVSQKYRKLLDWQVKEPLRLSSDMHDKSLTATKLDNSL